MQGNLATSLVLGGAAALLAGCVAVPTKEVSLVYSDSIYGKFARTGQETVRGQAFLRQQGGGVVVCAGEVALLLPKAGAIEESVRLARSGVKPVAASDPNAKFSDTVSAHAEFQKVVRKSVCDAQGNFVFRDIPAGDWYVYSRVRWVVADMPQGGDLLTEITTTGSGEQTVLLTDANRI